jgi:hypothetical protein
MRKDSEIAMHNLRDGMKILIVISLAAEKRTSAN